MREILFRVWDAQVKRMSEPFSFNSYAMFWTDGDSPMPLPMLVREERFLKMQFTGLFDKNGQRIFEGDVINAKTGFVGEVFEVVFDEVQAAFKIKVLEDVQSADYRKLKGELRVFHRFHTIKRLDVIEVIGNIHDNPELVESTK